MPHFPVLLYHLVPTSLRPRPHPPRLKRVRIHQPTNSTRLCSSTHTPEVSVPKGVATTCGDGTSPATADPTHKPNPAPPPVLAPRASRFAPRASHTHSRTSTPHSSSRARARTTSGHRQHDMCTGTTPSSCLPVFVLCRLCNVKADSAVACVVHAPRTGTA